ncbi:MAG: SemiSWEET transporter [Candidatus Omnitrophota bacterium]|jgi:MtN3 and saliva related transmembrane protein
MDQVTILGMLAATCTTAALFPQAYKIHRTGQTRDLSLPMWIIFTTGILLWLIYGIVISNLPIICANAVTLVLCAYILAMMAKNRGKA